ncbi:MAG: glycosyltransferase family 4 protein, partial [Campylobacterales bacterium]|nr:glycosyltransferase family 4 protein [Campylobacterales bacterium]
KVPEARKKLGWADDSYLPSNQKYIDSINNIETSLPDWQERTHIVPGFSSPFLKALLDLAISNDLKWVHWSERSGVGLAKLLHFNYGLIDMVYPMFLRLKGYKKYSKQVNQSALGCLAIGELAKRDFARWGINDKKIAFQPYSLDGLAIPKVISINLKKSDEIIFMYIGSLEERKGIDVLIAACEKIVSRSQWKLILVGDDRSNDAYAQQVEQVGLADQVEFIGVVQSGKINEYLAQADVFVLPTRFDGWGAVLNEAASLGKPIISTDQAGAAYHLIREGETGYMVKAGDADALAKAMQYYVDQPEQIPLQGKKSLEIFQNFTPEKSAELFVSNIQKFLVHQ